MTANYVVWVYGLAPEGIVPSTAADYLQIPVDNFAGEGGSPSIPTIPDPVTPSTPAIPDWIKD